MDYVHVNPLKHGLVQRVADWPHSTFGRYVERGIYPFDWAVMVGAILFPANRWLIRRDDFVWWRITLR